MNACEVIRYIIRDAFGWFCLNICVGLPVIESECCGYVCKLQALARRVRFGLGRDLVTNFRSLSPRADYEAPHKQRQEAVERKSQKKDKQ